MKKTPLILFRLFILLCFFMAGKTYAFGCSGQTDYNVGSFSAGRNAIDITLPSAVLSCSGDIGTEYNDALRVKSVTLNSKLIAAGFTNTKLNISSFGDFTYPFSDASYKCVWYSSSCLITGAHNYNVTGNTATFQPTLKRSAGVWPALTINNGEIILTIQLEQRSRGSWGWNRYIYYRLNGEIVTPDYTCAINTYDNTVGLPTTPVSDILSQSAGKVTSSKTPFNIQLDCESETRVSLQFDGTKMSDTGADDVLANLISGNSNMGIQLYRADTGTAIAFGNKYVAINSANTTENLKFNAYYYYKGGSVSAGMLKSLATFTFTYE